VHWSQTSEFCAAEPPQVRTYNNNKDIYSNSYNNHHNSGNNNNYSNNKSSSSDSGNGCGSTGSSNLTSAPSSWNISRGRTSAAPTF
ncbi:unnamed protein product, partial [Polarella glacialis]